MHVGSRNHKILQPNHDDPDEIEIDIDKIDDGLSPPCSPSSVPPPSPFYGALPLPHLCLLNRAHSVSGALEVAGGLATWDTRTARLGGHSVLCDDKWLTHVTAHAR